MTAGLVSVLINAINDNAIPRGPDRFLMELVPRMMAADPGLRVAIAVAPWQRILAQSVPCSRITWHVLRPPRRPVPRLIWQATGFVRFANAARPDVTFLPNLIWTPGLRSPSVVTAHDLLQFRAPRKFGVLKAMLLRPVIARALRRAGRVVAVSRFTAADVTAFARVAPSRLVTIPEGSPPPRTRPPGPPDKTFLFVGKIERTKGLGTLIAAFQRSEALRRAGYRLVIAGPDGNASAEVGRLIAKAPAGIERRGYVSEAELERLYLTCRAFVFLSEAEGFGLVLLEAMARGAPVIAARATALPEVVGEAGLLVPPGDVDATVAALERAAFDDALAGGMQAAGYARLEAFSWAVAGAAWAGLLREVAE